MSFKGFALEDAIASTIGDRRCRLIVRGCVPYAEAWEWQRSLVERRVQTPDLDIDDVLLLLEHPPTYTLGTGSTTEYLLFDRDRPDVTLYRTERGGEVTYHCPGQVVGYPILNLRYYRQDLHWYLRLLEEVLLAAIAGYGLPGERIPGLTGVWVRGVKVAAIGIKVRRWVTMHGFALNVCPDLSGFEQIVPCGIRDRSVGSLVQFCPGLTVEQVRRDVAAAFARVFGVELVPESLAEVTEL